ncbi:MAG: TraB/GumN family protein [Novosphingobium sp.]
MLRCLAGLLATLALAACAPTAEPAQPAFWRIDGPNGQHGWLLGTIHALPRPALWRSRPIDRALRETDAIVVEVGNLDDSGAMAREFASLAVSQDQPPLTQRVEPQYRQSLLALLKRGGLDDTGFARTDTWAAALTLARVGEGSLDSNHGIDRAIIRNAGGKPVVEIEGAHEQLSLFDSLPETEQRDLLELVVADAGSGEAIDGGLAQAWRKGDMATIERETRRGLLADPELRQALYTGRNQAWSGKIAAMLADGRHPFVAVGAAHMAGEEGLPALLASRGFKVTRLQ